MLRHIQVALLAVLVVGGVASAEEQVKFEYMGETFMIQPLPDAECCFEVAYEDVVGYMGVWVDGTPERPYGYTTSLSAVTPEGLIGGNLGYASAEDCLELLADRLLQIYRDNQSRREFDPKKEADELRDFIRSIPRQPTATRVPDSTRR